MGGGGLYICICAEVTVRRSGVLWFIVSGLPEDIMQKLNFATASSLIMAMAVTIVVEPTTYYPQCLKVGVI